MRSPRPSSLASSACSPPRPRTDHPRTRQDASIRGVAIRERLLLPGLGKRRSRGVLRRGRTRRRSPRADVEGLISLHGDPAPNVLVSLQGHLEDEDWRCHVFTAPRLGLPLTLLPDFPPGRIDKPTLYPSRGPSSSRGIPPRQAYPIGWPNWKGEGGKMMNDEWEREDAGRERRCRVHNTGYSVLGNAVRVEPAASGRAKRRGSIPRRSS